MKKNYRVIITQIIYRGTHEPLIKEYTLSWHRFWIGAWCAVIKWNWGKEKRKDPTTAQIRKLFDPEKVNENKTI